MNPKPTALDETLVRLYRSTKNPIYLSKLSIGGWFGLRNMVSAGNLRKIFQHYVEIPDEIFKTLWTKYIGSWGQDVFDKEYANKITWDFLINNFTIKQIRTTLRMFCNNNIKPGGVLDETKLKQKVFVNMMKGDKEYAEEIYSSYAKLTAGLKESILNDCAYYRHYAWSTDIKEAIKRIPGEMKPKVKEIMNTFGVTLTKEEEDLLNESK